ncbi:YjbF family lipoprotein [Niveispirillum sp.]|uniref:YjbF family lipoprotein n=1 Tax=Niveispirillum sp. TaxID=1917217 RepID=UPI003BA86D78
MTLPKSDPGIQAAMSRRQCLGLVAATILPAGALTGCRDLGNTESPYWATVAAVGGIGGKAPVTRAQADELPYASILAWLDDSSQAFMVLGEIGGNGALYYYSQTRQVLVTRGPFLVQTVGLPGDLSRTRFPGDQTPDLRQLAGTEWVRHVDIQAAGLFDLEVRGQVSITGTEEITILDRRYSLTRLREAVVMRGMKPFTNDYWIDASGFCWKSRQHIHDRTNAVNIEIVKPAG